MPCISFLSGNIICQTSCLPQWGRRQYNFFFTRIVAWQWTSVGNCFQLGRKNSELTAKRDEERHVQWEEQVQNTGNLWKQFTWTPLHFLAPYQTETNMTLWMLLYFLKTWNSSRNNLLFKAHRSICDLQGEKWVLKYIPRYSSDILLAGKAKGSELLGDMQSCVTPLVEEGQKVKAQCIKKLLLMQMQHEGSSFA